MGNPLLICMLVMGLTIHSGAVSERAEAPVSELPDTCVLRSGEKLTYDIRWAKIVRAGSATMEIRDTVLSDGRAGLRFIILTRSAGLVDRIYRVNDNIESVFDPGITQSLRFSLNTCRGRKLQNREQVFEHEKGIVISSMDGNPPETLSIPAQTQDALSALYYLRTRNDLVTGSTFQLQVYDSGKNWSVDVQTLGRESVTTPAGVFATVKVRTFPRYEGVFFNKGEIDIWLTDDRRKIPVLMKSMISIGSIVSTLTKIEPVEEPDNRTEKISAHLPSGAVQ